jgi:hypothetical protein
LFLVPAALPGCFPEKHALVIKNNSSNKYSGKMHAEIDFYSETQSVILPQVDCAHEKYCLIGSFYESQLQTCYEKRLIQIFNIFVYRLL